MRGKERCPVIVNETMVEHMKSGAVIVDVSIDTGGCFETSGSTVTISSPFTHVPNLILSIFFANLAYLSL
jgi:alanine dehydrogenase